MVKSVLALLKIVVLRLIVMMGIMTILRLFFTVYNSNCFSDWGVLEVLKGARVDASFIVYVLGLYFLSLIFLQGTFYYKIIKTSLFGIGILLILIPEMIDVMYFEFVLKRMTSDIFAYVRSGGEFWELLPQFLRDFWWIIFTYIGLMIFLIRQEYKSEGVTIKAHFFSKVVAGLLWIGVTVLIGRGGLQKRPLELSNATQGVPSQNSGIVLSSGFSLFSSFFVNGLEQKNYFTKSELSSIYSLEKEVISDREPNTKNVVVLILESFSQEYTGFYNKEGVSYTPFFDSLLSQSYVYKNAYANGKRSVEALPAIFAGIPSLMSTPYIFSIYAQNRINALPKILKDKGYNTSFYHGGHNGTMGFDGFCSQAGIDEYFGMDEYSGDLSKDFDGNWGVFDEPYLQYFAKELTKKKEPFFTSLFTLSSHHPYTVPGKYSERFSEGTLPIHRAVRYSDFALKQFFSSAKQEDWFNNTVFVLLADHTAQSESDVFSNAAGIYRIPIAVYEPSERGFLDTVQIVQQLDVMTLVLERLGCNEKVKTFGNASDDRTQALMYNDRLYQFIYKHKLFQYDGEQGFDSYQLNNGVEIEVAESEKNEVKAVIQEYGDVLIGNRFR